MPLWAHTMKKFRCGRNFFAFVPRRKPRLRGTPPQGIGHEPSLAVGKNPATFLFLPVAGNALHACRSRWQPIAGNAACAGPVSTSRRYFSLPTEPRT